MELGWGESDTQSSYRPCAVLPDWHYIELLLHPTHPAESNSTSLGWPLPGSPATSVALQCISGTKPSLLQLCILCLAMLNCLTFLRPARPAWVLRCPSSLQFYTLQFCESYPLAGSARTRLSYSTASNSSSTRAPSHRRVSVSLLYLNPMTLSQR